MMFTLFVARCLSEAVVEVGAVQPGGPFGAEGIRAFLDFHMLPVHIGNPDVNRRILVERVGGTRAQPQAIWSGMEMERLLAGTGLSSKAIPVRKVQLSS